MSSTCCVYMCVEHEQYILCVRVCVQVSVPNADSQGIGLLVQTSMIKLHAAVVHIHTVDQLTITTSCLLQTHKKSL